MRLETDPLSFQPSPTIDNAVVRTDGPGGNRIQASTVIIDDDGNVFIDTPGADAMDAKLNVRTGDPEKVGRATRATTAYAASASPDAISGLKLWYKADSIAGLNEGDPIGSLQDSSSSDKDLSSTGSQRPTYHSSDSTLNDKPVVEFLTANNTYLASASYLFSDTFATDQFCFYFVQKTFSTIDNNTSIGTELPDGERVNFHLGFSDGLLYCDYGNPGSGGRVFGSKPSGFDGTWHILKGIRQSDGSFNLYMDGVSILSGTYTDSLNASQSAPLYLGNFNGGAGFTGRIAEIIWFNTVPSGADQDKITNYLAQKYALKGTADTSQSADLDQFLNNAGTVIGRTGAKAELVYPSLSLTGDITLTPFSSSQNNLSPAAYGSDTAVIRMSASVPGIDITGIAGGTDGRLLILLNMGTEPITFTNEDSNSTEANRFSNGFDVLLIGGTSTTWRWDGVSSRWKLISSVAGIAGGDLTGTYPNPGIAKIGGKSFYSMSRNTLGGGSDDYVEIGNLAFTGAANLLVTVTTQNSVSNYNSKTYLVNVHNDQGSNIWYQCAAISSSGVFVSAASDYVLDAKVDGNTLYLRIRRTNPNGDPGTQYISLWNLGNPADSFVETSSTGNDLPAKGYFPTVVEVPFLQATGMFERNMSRTLAATVGATVNLGSFNLQSTLVADSTIGGGWCLVWAYQQTADFSTGKIYLVSYRHGLNSGTWGRVLPITNSGPNSLTDRDFFLETMIDGDGTVFLRAVSNTTFSASLANFTVWSPSLFTEDASTSTSSVTDIWPSTILTQVDGRVGIGTYTPMATLDNTHGGFATAVTETAGNYTMTYSDMGVAGDAVGGSITITLPPAANKQQVWIKKIDSSGNAVAVAGAGGDTIEGFGSVNLTTQNSSLYLVSNGNDKWYQLSKMGGGGQTAAQVAARVSVRH